MHFPLSSLNVIRQGGKQMKSITLMLMVAGLSLAQDQTVTIEAGPGAITAPTCVDRARKPIPLCDPLTPAAAPDLIKQALKHDQDPKRSYMIHVATPDEKKTEFQKEAWYMYQYGVQHPTFLQRLSDPLTNWFAEK